VGTSAGGARAKAVIAWNRGTNEVRSGQTAAGEGFEYWLLKFDGVAGNKDKEMEDPKGYGTIEYAYHLMAKAAGIDAFLVSWWGGANVSGKAFEQVIVPMAAAVEVEGVEGDGEAVVGAVAGGDVEVVAEGEVASGEGAFGGFLVGGDGADGVVGSVGGDDGGVGACEVVIVIRLGIDFRAEGRAGEVVDDTIFLNEGGIGSASVADGPCVIVEAAGPEDGGVGTRGMGAEEGADEQESRGELHLG
jgi:hypothetical protein